MGFTTGLLGGFTLTAAVVYSTLTLHTHNRAYQAALIRQQTMLMQNIVDPQPPVPLSETRIVRAGLWETVKDGWNEEVERGVRRVQNVRWDEVYERLGAAAGRAWRRLFEKAR
ncbi:hypothetical protein K470DRAFT_240407 [Piedraia hortae CBS 480.64]|uniref:MICOS complex subunit MIC12 n=1 Tax=Piedraia hortae CBS 480.64 TaxID=1314780 RepID=A0A6A7C9M0_9PEZI|nr:hypothetical protein K470DRAFT_240407 [Piedraia hortae CBS 480.64]